MIRFIKPFILSLMCLMPLFGGQVPDKEIQKVFVHGQFQAVSECPTLVNKQVDLWLSNFQLWGLNPTGVSTKDFDSAFVVAGKDPIPGMALLPTFHCVFQNKKTKKIQAFDAQAQSQYPTAGTLIQMSKPD